MAAACGQRRMNLAALYFSSPCRALKTHHEAPALNVRFWPKADMPQNAIDVAIRGKADMGWCSANVCF